MTRFNKRIDIFNELNLVRGKEIHVDQKRGVICYSNHINNPSEQGTNPMLWTFDCLTHKARMLTSEIMNKLRYE